jgi:hypothetical protein
VPTKKQEDSRAEQPLVTDAPSAYAQKTKAAKDKKFLRLAEEAMALEQEDVVKSGNLNFVARWLVHATLPYKEPKAVNGAPPPAWGRTSGNVSMLIQPGYYQKRVEVVDGRGRKSFKNELISYGYPYGSYPRLILAWIATEVVKNKNSDKASRTIQLGESLVQFMAGLGKHGVTGGARGTITILKNQMQKLFSAQIAVTTDPDAANWKNAGFRIADETSFESFWDPANPSQQSLWQSEIVLTERFYENILKNPVPVDIRIVKSLASSALAMDIYCWLTYRNAIIERDTKVPWEALMQQFGSEAAKHKFIEGFKRALKEVLVLYPEAKVVPDRSGLLLSPSPPSVRKLPRN